MDKNKFLNYWFVNIFLIVEIKIYYIEIILFNIYDMSEVMLKIGNWK